MEFYDDRLDWKVQKHTDHSPLGVSFWFWRSPNRRRSVQTFPSVCFKTSSEFKAVNGTQTHRLHVISWLSCSLKHLCSSFSVFTLLLAFKQPFTRSGDVTWSHHLWTHLLCWLSHWVIILESFFSFSPFAVSIVKGDISNTKKCHNSVQLCSAVSSCFAQHQHSSLKAFQHSPLHVRFENILTIKEFEKKLERVTWSSATESSYSHFSPLDADT